MSVPFIFKTDLDGVLSWQDAVTALERGHGLGRPYLGDLFLNRAEQGFLNRAAWVEGLGIGLKSVTVFPDNPRARDPLPAVQGVFSLFDDRTGALKAQIDGALITYWKTAADSVWGARLLARPEPKSLVIIGAGRVAGSLVEAYSEIFPSLSHIKIYARDPEKAKLFLAQFPAQKDKLYSVDNLGAELAAADIVAAATFSQTPVISGTDISPGCHVDLIGAYTPDMREADDKLLQKARLFVDCYDTTVDHIGEIMIPLANSVIERPDILADFYELSAGAAGRISPDDITVFKNGGGAHLDLMIAQWLFGVYQAGRVSS